MIIDNDKKEIIISSSTLNSAGKDDETSQRTISFDELEYMKIGEIVEPSLDDSSDYKKESLEILNKNRFHTTFKVVTEKKQNKSIETNAEISIITFDENLKKHFKKEDLSGDFETGHGKHKHHHMGGCGPHHKHRHHHSDDCGPRDRHVPHHIGGCGSHHKHRHHHSDDCGPRGEHRHHHMGMMGECGPRGGHRHHHMGMMGECGPRGGHRHHHMDGCKPHRHHHRPCFYGNIFICGYHHMM
ncbi:hypothetical protein LJC03_00775 [Methanobrevibacter sp. OttesenSCG-928-I08]|nr:hypothetical protein [Methanobrevibacter sp. OttesenSCG-928-I08]